MRHEDYVNMDDEDVRSELKNEYADIFHSIFVRVQSENQAFPPEYVYENAYKVRTTHVLGRNEEEYTITCITRGRISRRIKEYFVTRPYNVNLVPLKPEILGRFVFSRAPNNNLVLLAMAEESAHEWEWVRKTNLRYMVYVNLTYDRPLSTYHFSC